MADQLTLYNTALMYLGEESLVSLTEAREARYKLDQAWVSARKQCLEQGYWKFALRSVQLDASTSVTPSFGNRYAFQMPEDYVRLYQMSLDEYFQAPFNGFVEEVGYWFAESTPMYCRYVSSDASYGYNLGRWPESFTEYVARFLAARVCPSITGGDSKLADLIALEKKALTHALSRDATNGPAIRMQRGTWTRSRVSGGISSSNYDRA